MLIKMCAHVHLLSEWTSYRLCLPNNTTEAYLKSDLGLTRVIKVFPIFYLIFSYGFVDQ